eukprot:4921581-Amphidinium_carterae.1
MKIVWSGASLIVGSMVYLVHVSNELLQAMSNRLSSVELVGGSGVCGMCAAGRFMAVRFLVAFLPLSDGLVDLGVAVVRLSFSVDDDGRLLVGREGDSVPLYMETSRDGVCDVCDFGEWWVVYSVPPRWGRGAYENVEGSWKESSMGELGVEDGDLVVCVLDVGAAGSAGGDGDVAK